eukprot:gene2810-biopygen2875
MQIAMSSAYRDTSPPAAATTVTTSSTKMSHATGPEMVPCGQPSSMLWKDPTKACRATQSRADGAETQRSARQGADSERPEDGRQVRARDPSPGPHHPA